MSLHVRLRTAGMALSHAVFLTIALLPAKPSFAQQDALQPGEAYVTRFSGAKPGTGGAVIDTGGTVGSIIDVRAPRKPPLGQHWIDEPQRKPVTASQVGQVFGVTLDDASPPNVYLTATSAFGLHRMGNNWMPGMWGQGGGPGTIYRLDASTGYAPRVFTQITLNGRPNSAPALGNIAYDRINKQLFVSDLETGMIHRIRAADGGDLGFYDHGSQGRTNFTNVEDGQQKSLPPIAFDPNSRARIEDCQGRFDYSPQCWNFATTGRRVWGLGVRRDVMRNESRLYYAVWSSPDFGQTVWNQEGDDEKRNSVWSVRLGPNGGFDPSDVRREFILPDFFVKPEDIARSGYSQPVSDISFAECGDRPVMLVAERGGIRNLGLGAPNAFANPHEARALRYELDEKGSWRAIGRYEVGFADRRKEGAPYMRANCSGGIAFGPGYDASWVADPGKPDQFVWITGDFLCSPEGPCNLPEGRQAQTGSQAPQPAGFQSTGDSSEVHGVQGLAEGSYEEVASEAAFASTPPPPDAAAGGPNQAYLIDTDINVDASGRIIQEEVTANDATTIGDVAIYQVCEPPRVYAFTPYTPPSGHPTDGSHARLASHGARTSHYRWGSHDPYWSHNRWGSHYQWRSHWRTESHDKERSHRRSGSHSDRDTHRLHGSHSDRDTHRRRGSHSDRDTHKLKGSHSDRETHQQKGSHSDKDTHKVKGSHSDRETHLLKGSHTDRDTHKQKGSHSDKDTHEKKGSHSYRDTHKLKGSHNDKETHQQKGSHNDRDTHKKKGSHSDRDTHKLKGSHNDKETHQKRGSHSDRDTHKLKGSHSQQQTHQKSGSHSPRETHQKSGSHSEQQTHQRRGSSGPR